MRFFFYGTLMDADARALVLGRVDGLLAHGLDGAVKARIGHFEGDEYRFEARTVYLAGGASTDALVAMARKGVVPGRRSWELVPWQRRHKRVFLRALSGQMEAI